MQQTGLPQETLRAVLGVLITQRREMDQHIQLIEGQLVAVGEGQTEASLALTAAPQANAAPASTRRAKSRRKPASHHAATAAPSKPRGITAEGRKRIAAAQRERWAKQAAASGQSESTTKPRARGRKPKQASTIA